MAKTPKAQYEKLITIGSIRLQTECLINEVDIRKALSHSPEAPEVWADMARQAAANLNALAEKISPNKRQVGRPESINRLILRMALLRTEGPKKKTIRQVMKECGIRWTPDREINYRRYINALEVKLNLRDGRKLEIKKVG